MSAPAYLIVVLGTTVLVYPPGGPADGPRKDLTPTVGAGLQATPEMTVELDLRVTFDGDGYAGTALTPGGTWRLGHFFLAGRAEVTVDPTRDVWLLAGAGAAHTLASGVTPYAELDGFGLLTDSDHTVGLAFSAGARIPL